MKHLFLFLLWMCVKPFWCQDSLLKNKFSPSFHLHAGYIPKTYPVVPQSNFTWLASACIGWRFAGRDNWHQQYHFPRGGFELVYANFNNPDELGYSLGVVPFLELNARDERKHWKLRLGLGAAYFNKPYDALTNPNNFYIGSHFTNMSTAALFWQKKINEKLIFNYGATLVHSSNGHTALPNVGMNFLVLSLGISAEKPLTKFKHELVSTPKKAAYALKFGLGMHEFGVTTKAVGGPLYPSYHVSAWVSKPKGQIHLWQAGFTTAYYTSFYDYMSAQKINESNRNVMAGTGLVFAGHEFVFGKFSLSTQMGFYFWNRFFIDQLKRDNEWQGMGKLKAFNTNRLGILYYPFKKRNSLNHVKGQLMLGAYIKANVAQADLLEYCVGYVF